MPTGTIELLERDAELALIDALVDGTQSRRGRLAVLEGEPGIGKTALVEAALSRAGIAGIRRLAARGSELERGFAFGLVRQALGRAVMGRDELFAGRAALARSVLEPYREQRRAAATEGTFEGLYWLLAELADAEPLLLAIDDAHWADEESVAFLRFLALRLAGLPAAVLVATRPPAADDALAGLMADPAVSVARPPALGLTGTRRYLHGELAREPSDGFVTACQEATGGNPFLLSQLAQALRDDGIEPSAVQVGQIRPAGLARDLLARLDAPARSLARGVAVLGDDVAVVVAGELAGMTSVAAERAADALAAAGVFADQRPLRFRHELWRGAVLAAIPAGEQASARIAAVAVLRAHNAEPERIAAQLLQVESGRDPAAADTLREAASQASARGAPATAAALLRRALEEPLDRDARFTALMELGAAEQTLGRAEAAGRFIEAGHIAPDARRQRAAAVAAGHAAPLDPANCAPALELLDHVDLPEDDRPLAVRVMNARLAAAWTDITRFHAIAAEAHELGPIAGANVDERRLLGHLARARLEAGAPAAEVLELAERAADAESVDHAGWFVTMIIALTAVDRHEAAGRLAVRAVERARERGALADYHMAMAWRARIALLRGDLEDAEGLARAALEAGEVLRQWWRLIPFPVLIEALIDQGRVADAGAAWTATGLGQAIPPQRPLTPLLHARGRLRLAQGDPVAALEDLREVSRRIDVGTAPTVHSLTTRLRTAEAHHALADDDAAERESLAALDIARRFGAASSLGAALRVRGRLARDETLLREAADRLRDAPSRLEFARALIDLGAMMRRRGARRESREPLREGHEVALECSAGGLVETARSELAASGVHVERGTFARRDELTPSERRIATMAAGGASNKEIAQALFLTVKTVEMHLSSTYRKLDIRSRRELGGVLVQPAATQTSRRS